MGTLPLGHGVFPQYEFQEWMGKKHIYSFQTVETGKRAPKVNVSGANHHHRAPAQ